MGSRVVWYKFTDVSEQRAASSSLQMEAVPFLGNVILLLYLLSYFISHRMNYTCPEESLSEGTVVNRMTHVQKNWCVRWLYLYVTNWCIQ